MLWHEWLQNEWFMIHFIFITCQLFQQLFLVRPLLWVCYVKPNYDSVKVPPSTDRVELLDENHYLSFPSSARRRSGVTKLISREKESD
jgi:hypothetical protein